LDEIADPDRGDIKFSVDAYRSTFWSIMDYMALIAEANPNLDDQFTTLRTNWATEGRELCKAG
jgi:hypothetical protein